jgi:branched-subunit amino acid transport protein
MNAWLVILAAGLGSYLLRLSMIIVAVRLPARLDRAAPLVAPAAFAALAVTGVAGALTVPHQAVPALLALAVAVLAVVRTGSSSAAVLAGMPTLWLATALLPA